jgi:hypothetical protein
MQRLRLLLGAQLLVEPGHRGPSLMVRIADDRQATRLNQKLAAAISVVAAGRARTLA